MPCMFFMLFFLQAWMTLLIEAVAVSGPFQCLRTNYKTNGIKLGLSFETNPENTQCHSV